MANHRFKEGQKVRIVRPDVKRVKAAKAPEPIAVLGDHDAELHVGSTGVVKATGGLYRIEFASKAVCLFHRVWLEEAEPKPAEKVEASAEDRQVFATETCWRKTDKERAEDREERLLHFALEILRMGAANVSGAIYTAAEVRVLNALM